MAPPPITSLDHVALTVSDPQRSIAWYADVLGFVPARMVGLDQGPPFILRIGGTYLNLFPADGAVPKAPPAHDTLAMRHVAFRVPDGRLEELRLALVEKGQQVQAFDYGPDCHSLFVLDPDGHQLEFISYGEGVFVD